MLGEGFVPGSRGGVVMDALAVAMVLITPLLYYSARAARTEQKYELHKTIQIGIAVTLLIAVVIFEIYIRIYGWLESAKPSPYYSTTLIPFLIFHIVVAVLAISVWGIQIYGAIRNIGKNMERSPEYSARHRKLGWLGVHLMAGTSATALVFYYMAFIAS